MAEPMGLVLPDVTLLTLPKRAFFQELLDRHLGALLRQHGLPLGLQALRGPWTSRGSLLQWRPSVTTAWQKVPPAGYVLRLLTTANSPVHMNTIRLESQQTSIAVQRKAPCSV